MVFLLFGHPDRRRRLCARSRYYKHLSVLINREQAKETKPNSTQRDHVNSQEWPVNIKCIFTAHLADNTNKEILTVIIFFFAFHTKVQEGLVF